MKKVILVFVLMFGMAIYLHAGILNGPNPFGVGVFFSSIVLGDIDNDGDLDLIVTGISGTSRLMKKYINNGNGTFSSNSFGIGVYGSSIALGDIDNDNDLDLIVTGRDAGNNLRLIRCVNNGSGVFSTNSFGIGVEYGSIALGDIDDDGDLDLIVTGTSTGIKTGSRLDKYINNGLGTFSGTPIGTGVFYSSLVLGDIDDDGDLDLIVTGYATDDTRRLDRYINDGTGIFSGISFGIGVYNSSIVLGDIDNDCDLDLIVSGYDSGGGYHLDRYLNNGSGIFSSAFSIGTGVYWSSIASGDIDNDGDLDLIVTGNSTVPATGVKLEKYFNNGSGNFSGISFGTGIWYSSIALGDIDNDRDLDLIVTGQDSGGINHLDKYLNLEVKPNSSPSSPSTFYSYPNGNNWVLQWEPGSDDNSPANLLRYKVAIGTNQSGVYNYTSSVIDLPRGQANVGNAFSFLLTTIPVSKTVFWKVSTIDSAFQYSPFSTEQVATLKPTLVYPVNIDVPDSRPIFIWNKKSVESNIIQVSYNAFSSLVINSNIGLSTNFTPAIDLNTGDISWRVITYRQSCNTYFTSASALFAIDNTLPVLDIDKDSGPYAGSLIINIKAFQDSAKTIQDNTAICYASIYKENLLYSSLSQTGSLQITLSDPGQYRLEAYIQDTANNKSTTVQKQYVLAFSPVLETAVYPTVVNLNQRNSVKFVSTERKNSMDIQIMTMSGVLVKEIKNVNFSTGIYEWTIDNKKLFPAGQYIVKIGDKRTLMTIIK